MFKSKNGRLRSGWKILCVTLAFLGITTILTTILGIIVGIVMVSKGDLSALDPNFSTGDSQTIQMINLLSHVLQSICMIVVPIFTWKVIMKRKLPDMGLHSLKTEIKPLLMGLLLGAVSMFIVFFLFLITGFGHVESFIPRFSMDTFTYLIVFIFVGFSEEIYGRGFIMGALKQTKIVPLILIVSSIIFALLHGLNDGFTLLPFINLTLVGLLFAYIYIKSDSIWMCIGYHITWNYFQGNVFGLNVSGIEVNGLITTEITKSNLFTGKDFGPEGGLFVTFVILLGFLAVTYFYRNKKVDFLASERAYEEDLLQKSFHQTIPPYDAYMPGPQYIPQPSILEQAMENTQNPDETNRNDNVI